MTWDKKLILAMASFIIFIVVLGAVMIIRYQSDTLVEDDYYEKGQSYEIDYQAMQKAVDDGVTPTITVKETGLIIIFPIPVKYILECRRTSDYRLDRLFKGHTGENRFIKITRDELGPGPWSLRVQYSTEDKNYLYKDKIMIP